MYRKARAEAEGNGQDVALIKLDSEKQKHSNTGLYEIGTDSD